MTVARPTDRRRGTLWLCGPGLVLGVLAALHHLRRPSLWFDEAMSVAATKDLAVPFRQSGATMAPYYAILRAWSAVGTSPEWLRVLSLLFALAALVATVHLGRRWLGDGWAAWAGVFLALSWLWADQAGEARAYTLAMLLTVLSWLMLDGLLTASPASPSRRWRVAHVVLWLLLPSVHGLTVLIASAQLIALVIARADRRVIRDALPGLAVGVAVTAGLFVWQANSVTNWVPANTWWGFRRVLLAMSGPTEATALVVAAGAVLGVVAATSTWRRADASPLERFRAVAPAAWALVPVTGLAVLTLASPLLVPRYMTIAAPGVALLLAGGARWIQETTGRDRVLPVGAALALLVFSVGLSQAAIRSHRDDRWDRAADLVESRLQPGDILLLPERRIRVPLEVAWPAGGREPTLADFDRVWGRPRYVEPERTPARALDALAGHRRVWVVYQTIFDPSEDALLHDQRAPQLRARYRVARHWVITGNIQVWLYEAR